MKIPVPKPRRPFAEEIEAKYAGVTVVCVKEVALVLGVSSRHVGDMIEEGKIQAFNIAGRDNKRNRSHWRVPVSALVAYVKDNQNYD